MSYKLTCCITKEPFFYDIDLQKGLLKDKNKLQKYLSPIASKFAIISDENVAILHGQSLLKILSSVNFDCTLISFSGGEKHKIRTTKEQLEDQLCEHQFGRDSCVIAIGGGVTTDIAGFIAATYCRGVPLVMIPTSLLAMVDASIGGKAAIDTSYGKNLIGCIYQPKKILIDPSVLNTLPLKEIKNGVVEMIKHALIANANYFAFLEHHAEEILSLKSELLEKAIFISCGIKKNIVEEDEMENGKRHLLNFGHTIGHAIELLTNYQISHGEAVAVGLLVESHMAHQLGYLKSHTFDKIHFILRKYGLPLKLPNIFPVETFFKAMSQDKKSLKGQPRFVILQAIGFPLQCEGQYCMHIPENVIFNALKWMNHDLCGN